MLALMRDLNAVYAEEPALWELDHTHEGFLWLEPNAANENVLAYARRSEDGKRWLVVACNFAPVVREGWRIGLPKAGKWREALNTDSRFYGGSDVGNGLGIESEKTPWNGQKQSAEITLPPLGRRSGSCPLELTSASAGCVAERANSIEVEGLVREFKKGPRAVDGIDLRVEPGEIYGFLGPNGAGKSTTVLMLTTLLPPTAGTARVGGFDVVSRGAEGAQRDRRRAPGGGARPAADRPRAPAPAGDAARDLPRRAEAAGATSCSSASASREAADRKVGGYSGGMKRRLDLALALVHRPRILFLDEPTTGLDIQSRTALWDEVARLARDEGVTVFLTTQYLEEADVLANRVGIIDHGHIVAEGTPHELKAEIGRPSVEAVPARPRRPGAARRRARPLRRVARRRHRRRRRPAARRAGRAAGVVRALDDAGLELAAPRAPGADARRRLPRQDRPLARGRRRGRARTRPRQRA